MAGQRSGFEPLRRPMCIYLQKVHVNFFILFRMAHLHHPALCYSGDVEPSSSPVLVLVLAHRISPTSWCAMNSFRPTRNYTMVGRNSPFSFKDVVMVSDSDPK